MIRRPPRSTLFPYTDALPISPDYPVSDGQRRLWVLSQLEHTSRAYHLPGVLVLEAPCQGEHLQAALLAVLERHQVLRTVFGENADRKSTRLNSSHANISYAVF